MEVTKTYTNTVVLDGRRYVEVGNLERIYSVGTEIHFTDNINDDTIESLIKETTHVITENIKSAGYRSKDTKLNITFIVDSPGGSVTAVLKFVDFIRMAKEKHPNVEFTSIITGMVASAGTILCAVADHRCMTKHAFAMIHELATGNVGKYTQLISHADFITTMHNTLVKIYQDVCGKSVEEIEALMMRETWYSAEKYLQHGFVDELR